MRYALYVFFAMGIITALAILYGILYAIAESF